MGTNARPTKIPNQAASHEPAFGKKPATQPVADFKVFSLMAPAKRPELSPGGGAGALVSLAPGTLLAAAEDGGVSVGLGCGLNSLSNHLGGLLTQVSTRCCTLV